MFVAIMAISVLYAFGVMINTELSMPCYFMFPARVRPPRWQQLLTAERHRFMLLSMTSLLLIVAILAHMIWRVIASKTANHADDLARTTRQSSKP